jgi:hypothetical protein
MKNSKMSRFARGDMMFSFNITDPNRDARSVDYPAFLIPEKRNDTYQALYLDPAVLQVHRIRSRNAKTR